MYRYIPVSPDIHTYRYLPIYVQGAAPSGVLLDDALSKGAENGVKGGDGGGEGGGMGKMCPWRRRMTTIYYWRIPVLEGHPRAPPEY